MIWIFVKKIIFAVSAFLLCLNFFHCGKNNSEDILAQVGEYSISQKDFLERYEKFLSSIGLKDSPIARQQILSHMVNEILLAKFDDNDHIINSPEYKNAKDLIWKELLLSYYKKEEIYKKIKISDEELRDAFVRVNEKISVRHLFARTLEEANKLYDQVMGGMTFEQLAPLVFEDKELSQNGGYLGYFTWGDMDPAFEEAAYSLKVGEISKPVQTDYGYSIVKVEDRFKNPILTEYEYNQKKKSLRRLLGLNKIKKQEKEYLKNILDKLAIKFNENAIHHLTDFTRTNYEDPDLSSNINNTTLLTYSNGSISVKEGKAQIKQLAASNRKRIKSEGTIKAALKGLVLQQWLINDAQSKDYDDAEQFIKVYDQWIFGELINLKKQDLVKSIQIPDTAVIKYYQKNKTNFMSEEKINVQEILVDSKKLALKIMQMLNAGQDFAKIAQRYSIREWAAKNGGILGLSEISRFGYFKKYLKDIPKMKIIGPEKIDEYYVIARIIGREEAAQLSLDQVKDSIMETIRLEKKQQHFLDYIKALREKNQMVINQKQLMEAKIAI